MAAPGDCEWGWSVNDGIVDTAAGVLAAPPAGVARRLAAFDSGWVHMATEWPSLLQKRHAPSMTGCPVKRLMRGVSAATPAGCGVTGAGACAAATGAGRASTRGDT